MQLLVEQRLQVLALVRYKQRHVLSPQPTQHERRQSVFLLLDSVQVGGLSRFTAVLTTLVLPPALSSELPPELASSAVPAELAGTIWNAQRMSNVYER
jgi:hypothetical protein